MNFEIQTFGVRQFGFSELTLLPPNNTLVTVIEVADVIVAVGDLVEFGKSIHEAISDGFNRGSFEARPPSVAAPLGCWRRRFRHSDSIY